MEPFRFRFNGPLIKASGLLEVDPNILKSGLALYFEVKNENPKEKLELESGYTQTFTRVSSEPFEQSLKLRIYHIAYASKVVLLIERYEIDNDFLYKPFSDLCEYDEFIKIIKRLQELPEDWTGSTGDRLNHPLGFIESIIRRIQQVETIQKEARMFSSEVPIAKSGLALFILCTCIESIGRSNDFIQYYDWLMSRRTRDEVNKHIKTYENEDKLIFLKKIYDEYLNVYGFRRAFYNFFFTHLNGEWQEKLSNTVEITINRPPTFEVERKGGALESLINYLENFRNNFAHHLQLNYSVPLKREIPKEWIESYANASFFTYQYVYDDGSFQTVITRNLVNELKQAIRLALWNWLIKESLARAEANNIRGGM